MELCRLNVSGKMPLDDDRMLFLTPLGECTLTWEGGTLDLGLLDTVVIPAALEHVVVEGSTKVLMSSLPAQEKLRAELTYRAENVAGLVEG